jgi:hypothetical protein
MTQNKLTRAPKEETKSVVVEPRQAALEKAVPANEEASCPMVEWRRSFRRDDAGVEADFDGVALCNLGRHNAIHNFWRINRRACEQILVKDVTAKIRPPLNLLITSIIF